MAGMTVDLALNAAKFKRGADDAERALDKVDSALDDLDSTSKGADLDTPLDKLDSAAKDAERGLDDVEDAAKDAERAVDDIDGSSLDDVDEHASSTSGSLQGIGETAGSVAGDMTDAFSGSADDIGETMGQLASDIGGTFGAGGLLAGALGGAALAGLIQSFQDAQDESRKLAEQAADDAASIAAAYIEAGGTTLTFAQQMARIQDVVTDADSWQEAQNLAETAGIDIATAVAAIAGDTDALAEAQEALNQAVEDFDHADYSIFEANEYGDALAAMQQAQETIDSTNASLESGAAAYNAGAAAIEQYAQATATTTEAVGELGDTLYTLPDETQVLITADGNALTDPEQIQERLDELDATTAEPEVVVGGGQQAPIVIDNIKRRLGTIPTSVRSQVSVAARVDDSAVRSWQPAPKSMAVIPYVRGSVRSP